VNSEIHIADGDPRDPAVRRLLEASHALMQSLFPAGACHYLSIDALCVPQIRLFAARNDEVTLGCCALSSRDGYGEVKSMFVDPAARGTGVAEMLLARIEHEARLLELPILRLETGDKLASARRLYLRSGYKPCGPFGDYVEVPTSLFMEKRLD